MSETVVFEGAYMRSFEFRNGDGDKHIRIQITASWKEEVRRAMHWGAAHILRRGHRTLPRDAHIVRHVRRCHAHGAAK